MSRYLVVTRPEVEPHKWGVPKQVRGFGFCEFAEEGELHAVFRDAERAAGLTGGVTVFNLDDAHEVGRLMFMGMLASFTGG